MLCYSGDTGPNEHLARAARDADLFLCEASWLDGDASATGHSIHLTAREAGAAARASGARRTVLTHVWPRNDRALVRAQAEQALGKDVTLASDIEKTEV